VELEDVSDEVGTVVVGIPFLAELEGANLFDSLAYELVQASRAEKGHEAAPGGSTRDGKLPPIDLGTGV
jgi:hypothetical protein